MDAKQYEAGRRELARREFVTRCQTRLILRLPFREYVDAAGRRCREHVALVKMEAAGVGWGQVADLDDSQLIHLDAARAVPEDVRRTTGVVAVKASDVKWDDLLMPYSDQCAGHFSYAHTTLHASDSFTHSNNPLSNHADWSALSDGTRLKSDGAKVVFNNNGGYNSRYTHDPSDMSAVSADYSVEAALSGHYDGAYRNPAISLRVVDGDNQYFLLNISGLSRGYIRRRKAGVETTLSSATTNYANTVLWRLQVVGQQLTGYINGLVNADVADPMPNGMDTAGSAGIYFYREYALTIGSAYIDDFAVYITGVSSSRRRRLIAS